MEKFKIEVTHFYCLDYIENDKRLTFPLDFREAYAFIGRSLIKNWERPFQTEEISPSEKDYILSNIKQFLIDNNYFKINDIIEIE